MKYKVGDKVRIRRDLVTYERYGTNSYVDDMEKTCKAHGYVLTISECVKNDTEYLVLEGAYNWTDEMIEGLYEPTDREKFEGWMRKLSSLDDDKVWYAFDRCTVLEPNEDGYEDYLKTVADYLFGTEKKKMTKAEIEAELGYEIEIVE